VSDVRVLGVGDGDVLHHVCTTVLAEFTGDPSTARQFLERPESFALGAYEDGEPVGLAWGIQMRSPSGRLTTYLHELEVRSEWRRRGIATALVTGAMDHGRRSGSTRFWLSTGMHNEVAQRVYESLGGDRKPLGDVNYWWEIA
jgi:ribosomal protein S18 acetylase RimI-like enzyme